MQHFLFASDSFKGSLDSQEIHAILARVVKDVLPRATYESFPMADGGEGTLDAICSVKGGTRLRVTTHDPLMREIETQYLLLDSKTAYIEMAASAGFTLLSEKERNPLKTTTYGVGETILQALKAGAENILIGAGGSATNDAATGALAALGFRFLDREGKELAGTGQNLAAIDAVDIKSAHPLLRKARFTVLTDVKNPLLGNQGATYVFAPQKGATKETLPQLEAGMENFYRVTRKTRGDKGNDFLGAGAAGGLAYGLKAFLNATVVSGIETLLALHDFDRALTKATYVITGEGSLDKQSLEGKVVSGIARHAQKAGVPVVAIVGQATIDKEILLPLGLQSIYPLVGDVANPQEAIDNAKSIYEIAARRFFETFKKEQA